MPSSLQTIAGKLAGNSSCTSRRIPSERAGSICASSGIDSVSPRPPVEVSILDGGESGPILGTIHASKGREAEEVLLAISNTGKELNEEESRVMYVGITRARSLVQSLPEQRPVFGKKLDSGRTWLPLPKKTQKGFSQARIEVGRMGDLDGPLVGSGSRP